MPSARGRQFRINVILSDGKRCQFSGAVLRPPFGLSSAVDLPRGCFYRRRSGRQLTLGWGGEIGFSYRDAAIMRLFVSIVCD
jgi:hypothetical protein